MQGNFLSFVVSFYQRGKKKGNAKFRIVTEFAETSKGLAKPKQLAYKKYFLSNCSIIALTSNSTHIRAAQCIDKEILISKNGNVDFNIEIDKRIF